MTSSPRSRRAPAFADHAAALGEALLEVAENSFFAFVSECDRDFFEELTSSDTAEEPGGWLIAGVTFSGAFGGNLTATMPASLARSLLAAFTGLEPETPAPQEGLPDAAGEFTNMVCGAWLTRTCQRRRFDLSPPRVERMPAGWKPAAGEPAGPQAGRIVRVISDLPLRLDLSFEQGWA